MIYIVHNLVPIIIATLAGLGVGAVVYRRAVPDARLRAVLPLAFVAEFWLCAILAGALILAPPKAEAWTMALGSAFIIWVGFVMPALVVTHRLRGLSMRAAALDCGHWLAVMLVQAAVMQAWGLSLPPGVAAP